MKTIEYKFVKQIPKDIPDGILFISIEFETIMHKCCCGCGKDVITPISPNQWKLTFDGESVSLYPSIGNWSFDCQSHYWIKKSKILWAEKWTADEIDSCRKHEEKERNDFYYKKHNKRKWWKLF